MGGVGENRGGVLIGVADGDGMHTTGEWIRLSSIELGRRQLEMIVLAALRDGAAL